MPAKRRQRGKVRGKGPRAKDFSSEDMDSQDQVNEITDRLAKKQLKSSTDTEVEHQDQKENQGKKHGEDGYDADFETSEFDTTSAGSDMDTGGDGYDADFETSEFDTTSAGSDMDYQTQPSKPSDSFRGVLSPSQGSSLKRKGGTKGSLQKQVILRQRRQVPTQNSNKSSKSSQSQQSTQTQGRRQSKRKTGSTDSTGPSQYSSMASSLLKSPEMMFSLPNGSDSSTPLSGAADSKSEMNDSCFGFEGLLSPPQQQPLPFSPVLPESPSYALDSLASSPPLSHREEVVEEGKDTPPSPSPSDNLVLRLSPSPERTRPESSLYSSMDSKSHVSLRGGQKRKVDVKLMGLIHKEEEKGPPKKTVKRRKTQKKKEEDAWTLKMSTEFDDIDMFELTVE